MIKFFDKTLSENETSRFIEMINEGKGYVDFKDGEKYFNRLINQIKIEEVLGFNLLFIFTKEDLRNIWEVVVNHRCIIDEVDGGLERFVVDLYEVFVKNGFRD